MRQLLQRGRICGNLNATRSSPVPLPHRGGFWTRGLMRRFTFWPWRTGFRGLLAAYARGSRLPPHHFLVIVITICGLAGCASPKGFLEAVAAGGRGRSKDEVLVATTRERTTPGEMFSGFRGPALDFADIVVSIPPV